MNCEECREEILERCDAAEGPGDDAVAEHVSGCAECAAFVEEQRALDAELMAALPVPELPAELRGRVLGEARRQRRGRAFRALPELAVLGGGVAASVACAMLLPFAGMEVAAIGIAFTAVMYLLETAALSSLEDADEAA